MRITAALCWWDEQPVSLRRCVVSLAGVCDRLVALDGRWAGMPGDTHLSDDAAPLALAAAAAEAGLMSVIVQPDALFASQAEKRALLMEIARDNADWLLVIDGDEYLEHANPATLHATLAATDLDVAELPVRNAGRAVRNLRPEPLRRLYRANTGVTVPGPAHNIYQAADGRRLNGPGPGQLADARDVSAHLALVNDTDARDATRRWATARYYRDRARTRAEVTV